MSAITRSKKRTMREQSTLSEECNLTSHLIIYKRQRTDEQKEEKKPEKAIRTGDFERFVRTWHELVARYDKLFTDHSRYFHCGAVPMCNADLDLVLIGMNINGAGVTEGWPKKPIKAPKIHPFGISKGENEYFVYNLAGLHEFENFRNAYDAMPKSFLWDWVSLMHHRENSHEFINLKEGTAKCPRIERPGLPETRSIEKDYKLIKKYHVWTTQSVFETNRRMEVLKMGIDKKTRKYKSVLI